jgi:hypothetical protein
MTVQRCVTALLQWGLPLENAVASIVLVRRTRVYRGWTSGLGQKPRCLHTSADDWSLTTSRHRADMTKSAVYDPNVVG